MRGTRFLPLCAFALALAALPAGAQELSRMYSDWADGPAHLLFTRADREAWKEVGSDREAEDFIRLFWARRDPTPETPDNEFRREFERRVAYTDQQFGETVDGEQIRGALTDRGRALILLGPPRRVQTPGAGGSATGGDFGATPTGELGIRDSALGGSGPSGVRGGATERFGAASEAVWIYEGDSRPAFMEKKRVSVKFRSTPGSKGMEIIESEEGLGYMGAAIEAAVVHPELTLADLTPAEGAGAVAAGSGGGFGLYGADPLTDPRALDGLHASLGGGGSPALPAHLDAGAFQASDGTWIVPVQVATEAAAPAAGTVLVGELVDAAGESKVAFRAAPEWKESRDQRYAKATVVAPPGEYRVRAGLESPGGEVLWAGEEAVTVPAVGGGFWVSQVVLSEDIHPMQQAQVMLEPWSWMGIEVVPEGDRTFAQGGAVWYYLHACAPKLDETGKPRLRVSMQLTGAASFRGPAVAEPVKAGDNCWVLASAFDLLPDRFPAGDYSMQLSVRDSVGGETLQAGPIDFKVAAGG